VQRPRAWRAAAAGAALLVPILAAGQASAWSCRNEDVEVTCGWDGCKASESFTPMEVHVSSEGMMEICAYSGCWRGQANQRVSSNRWILLAAERMHWMGSGQSEGAFALALDRETGVAVLNGEGFAQPMLCE
jgi:hypothetical protein